VVHLQYIFSKNSWQTANLYTEYHRMNAKQTEAVRSPLSSVGRLGHSRDVAPSTTVPFGGSGG